MLNPSPSQKKIALNSICAGVTASLLMKYFVGDVQDVDYFGMKFSAPLATGLACGVGSVVSDLTSEMVIKRLAITNQIMNGSTLAVQAGVGGLASAGVLYFGGAPITMSNMVPTVMIGAGSKLGGDYLNNKIFDPKDGFIPLF